MSIAFARTSVDTSKVIFDIAVFSIIDLQQNHAYFASCPSNSTTRQCVDKPRDEVARESSIRHYVAIKIKLLPSTYLLFTMTASFSPIRNENDKLLVDLETNM